MKHEDFKEEYGYEVEELTNLRQQFQSKRARKERIWKTLDSYDSGDFWDTVQAELPDHQIIPDTNLVFYVKDNIVNSVYAAPYIADVMPTDPADNEVSREINKFMEHEYNKNQLGFKQLRLGSMAALKNVGFMQLAWDANKKYKVGEHVNEGGIDYTTRDPMAVLTDPNYEDFQEGRALFILSEDSYENIVDTYPEAYDDLEEFFNKEAQEKENPNQVKINYQSPASQRDVGKGYTNKDVAPLSRGMLPVYISFRKYVRNNKTEIDQIIYTIDNIVLESHKNIKPSYFPVVALYGLYPEKDSYGRGVCQRILKNALTVNIFDSISATHAYAAQEAPVVVNVDSGLNPDTVAQGINTPRRVFGITGYDADKVIHRLELPDLDPKIGEHRERLEFSIKSVSGIDERYTGRDTGSVTTTGGMERLQTRTTMTDNSRIQMIEKYATELTSMVLDFYTHHGGSRSFAAHKSHNRGQREVMTIDFNNFKDPESDTTQMFEFEINASPLLPKNRQRLAEAANTIMEVQMQYQGEVELMSPEEWLFFQDFPQKDMMLDRMKLEKYQDDYEDIASIVSSFSSMTNDEGVRPEAAIEMLANERREAREPGVMKEQAKKKVRR